MNRGLADAFRAAGDGLAHALRTQRNLRLQLGIGAAVAAMAWWLEADATQVALLLLAIALVVTSELLNTSIEVLTDATAPRASASDASQAPGKVVKDVAAGAVVVAAGAAAAVGVVVLGPGVLSRIGVTDTAWLRGLVLAAAVVAGLVGAAWRRAATVEHRPRTHDKIKDVLRSAVVRRKRIGGRLK
ncbi:MAG: diacylglycerol kinase [Armatimonadota bacterium]|nr:diacylglycerol kinase [Armatimonadota bacterium]MDR5697193.1 diacylglycerol kinase [Armatimonadota bacterium]